MITIYITGNPNEIYNIMEKLHEKFPSATFQALNIDPPPNSIVSLNTIRFNDLMSHASSYGGGGINNHGEAVQMLANIDNTLRALSTLIENIAVTLNISIQRSDMLSKP